MPWPFGNHALGGGAFSRANQVGRGRCRTSQPCGHMFPKTALDNPAATPFLERPYPSGSKSAAPCLHSGQMKSSGNVSPSCTYPQILHTHPFFPPAGCGFGFTFAW